MPRPMMSATIGVVCRLCHTIAGATGSPVARSQITVVSRWLVIPIAATRSGAVPACASTSRVTRSVVSQISVASWLTQPGWGKCWVISSWATAIDLPACRTASPGSMSFPGRWPGPTVHPSTGDLLQTHGVRCRCILSEQEALVPAKVAHHSSEPGNVVPLFRP